MCLVSVLPKGTSKYSDEVTSFITNGFRSNRHGSGFMYKRDGDNKITVNKGFFDLTQLLEAIENVKLTDDDELAVHHRICTAGLVSEENTHPFVISKDHDLVCNTHVTTDKPCLVHNGIFSGISDFEKLNKDFSDTYAFCRYIMSNIIDLYKNETALFTKSMSSILGGSKICVLFPDRDLIITGNFIERNGYYHSNHGFEDWNTRDYGGSSMNSKKNSVGGTGAASNQLRLNSVLEDLKERNPLVFDGNTIDITEFNYDHFVYQSKDKLNSNTYLIEELPENNWSPLIMMVDKGNYLQINHSSMDKLHSDYNFHPKNQYKKFYEEYVNTLYNLTPSKNVFKDIHRILINNRGKDLSDTFKIKKLKVTRFTLINYFMSLVKNHVSKDSQFFNTKVEEFMGKSLVTPVIPKIVTVENMNEGVELFPLD